MLLRPHQRLFLGLGISGLLLWAVFRNVDPARMMLHVRTAKPGYVALFVAALTVSHGCRVLRWDVLTRPFAHVPTLVLLRVCCVGLMLMFVLPFRLGELARPVLLKRACGAPITSTLGAVAVERTLDGLCISGLFFVATLTTGYVVPRFLWIAACGALAIFATTATAIGLALVGGNALENLLWRWGRTRWGRTMAPNVTAKVVVLLRTFVAGLRALPQGRHVAAMLVLTGVYWGITGLGWAALLRAFAWNIPLQGALVVMCVVVIGVMVPAGPGFLGTFQGAVHVALSLFGLGANAGAAVATVAYPAIALVAVGFGLPFAFSLSLSDPKNDLSMQPARRRHRP